MSIHTPVVDYTMDHHPFGLDAVAVILVVQDGVLRVFCSPLLALRRILLIPGAVVQTWGLVHVRLALVVPKHNRVENLQLDTEEMRDSEI